MKKIKLNLIEITCIILLAACFMFLCIQQGRIKQLEKTSEYYECLEKELWSTRVQMTEIKDQQTYIISAVSDWQSYQRDTLSKIKTWKSK